VWVGSLNAIKLIHLWGPWHLHCLRTWWAYTQILGLGGRYNFGRIGIYYLWAAQTIPGASLS